MLKTPQEKVKIFAQHFSLTNGQRTVNCTSAANTKMNIEFVRAPPKRMVDVAKFQNSFAKSVIKNRKLIRNIQNDRLFIKFPILSLLIIFIVTHAMYLG